MNEFIQIPLENNFLSAKNLKNLDLVCHQKIQSAEFHTDEKKVYLRADPFWFCESKGIYLILFFIFLFLVFCLFLIPSIFYPGFLGDLMGWVDPEILSRPAAHSFSNWFIYFAKGFSWFFLIVILFFSRILYLSYLLEEEP